MKKTPYILGVLITGALTFTSCTKNLKDDINDLKNQVDTLHRSNDSIAGRLNGIELILGANEPLTGSTNFTDNNNATRTVNFNYQFKAGNINTHYAQELANGKFNIFIRRFSDVEIAEEARIAFIYDAATKEITNKEVAHYWNNADNYTDRAAYGIYVTNHPGLSITITVNSFNPTTGEISLTANASADAAYSAAVTQYVFAPNPGKPYSTTLSFSGKLKVFPLNG